MTGIQRIIKRANKTSCARNCAIATHLARAIAAERALERIAEEFWREGVTHEQFIRFALKEVRRITGSGLAVVGKISPRVVADSKIRAAVIDAYGIMFPESEVGECSDRQSWFNQHGKLINTLINSGTINPWRSIGIAPVESGHYLCYRRADKLMFVGAYNAIGGVDTWGDPRRIGWIDDGFDIWRELPEVEE